MKATFEIKKSPDGRFIFDLKAANDQVILTSQTYQTKEGAEDGGDRLPYFVLRAPNRQVIGRSQLYSSREAMRKGIASVKRNAHQAGIVDFTARVRSATGESLE